MSKEVEVEIKIDSKGKVHILPKGTIGNECLELLKFFDKIDGIKNISITMNQDYMLDIKNKNIRLNNFSK